MIPSKAGLLLVSSGAFLLPPAALSYASRVDLLHTVSAMIEIMIERWTNAKGETDFRWSVWSNGSRIQSGPNLHSTVEDSEAEALEFCWRDLGHKPDKVTRL